MNTKKVYPLFYVLLPLILYTAFFILPSVMGLALSFTNWNSRNSDIDFIGFEHFREIFLNKRNLPIISNTFIFAIVTTLFKNLIGLGMALVLNINFRSRNVLRTIYFMPVVLTPLIVGLVFTSIFDVDYGIINQMLRAVGFEELTKQWLRDKSTALISVMFVEIWRLSGQNMVIYVAGLQSISPDYMEAAEIDGAGPLQKFINIMIPQLMPSIRINVILNIIAGLKAFDLVFVMTKGGPSGSTELLNTAVYSAYSSGRYGFSTALSLIMFVLTTVIAFSVLRALSKGESSK